MTAEFNWSLPMFDDEGAMPSHPPRPPTLGHLTAIAKEAEAVGFHALLLGAGWSQRVEAFTTAAAVLQHVPRIRALIAVRPGFYHPAITAKLFATVDQQANGRALLNVVTGGVPSDLATYGDFLAHDDRYARCDEFLEILRTLTSGGAEPLDHVGVHYTCRQTRLDYGLVGTAANRIYFGGYSEPAREVGAKHADVYLIWGLPVEEVAKTIADLSRRAERHGRSLRFGVRINVIARQTSDAAWERAEKMLRTASDSVTARMVSVQKETDSVGQRRMFALTSEGPERRGTYWTGLSRLRVGSGTALVGSYREVADGLRRYCDVGVDTFILASAPHLEECTRVGAEVLPLVGA